MADMPPNDKVIQLCGYYDLYVKNIGSFFVSITLKVITKIIYESFHSKYNAYLCHHHCHPSPCKFIDALQDIQIETYIKIKRL